MVKTKIMTVFGTRPEAIKMLPVVRAFRDAPLLSPIVVSTGQHREMLDQVFEAFGEKADIDLSIMSAGQTLPDLTSAALAKVTETIHRCKPDLVVVHGDTTTAMASALAAFYANIPVAHVEAGLRSHDIHKPWPEEFNRVAIDAIADLLFAPTSASAENLSRETLRARDVHVTGNTGIDALLHVSSTIGARLQEMLPVALTPGKALVLVTGHRRESFGNGFKDICAGIRAIAARDDVEIVYPVHLNPNVREAITIYLAGNKNIHLIDPVPYEVMVALMCASKVILTDSGGIQEEGPALGKPVVVMRDVTERPEAVQAGVVSLVGTDPIRIANEVCALLDDEALYESRARKIFPYGDGHAAKRIATIVTSYFQTRPRR